MTRFFNLFALTVSALVSVGCSTPPVTGAAAREEASSAYESCYYVMTAYGRQEECRTVTPYATSTYTPTTYQAPTYDQYGQYRRNLDSGKPVANEEELRREYLETLDEDALKEVTAKWNELARNP